MTQKRKPFPQFNQFRPFVVTELQRRKTAYPLAPSAPFVRLTSCMEDTQLNYAFFSLGLHGFDDEDRGADELFNLAYGDRKEVVGYAYSISKNRGRHTKRLIFSDDISPNVEQFRAFINERFTEEQAQTLVNANARETLSKNVPAAAHPVPGITSISVTRGGLGQPLDARVQWQCYNQGQLEFLRNHFLSAGNHVILEFGTQYADRGPLKTLPFNTSHEAVWNDLSQAIGIGSTVGTLYDQGGRTHIINNYVEPNNGNYDFIVGTVSNFEVNIEPETGIFKCMTRIVSQGENVWGININTTFVDQRGGGDTITTIKDYFTTFRYDQFLESARAANTTGVARAQNTGWETTTNTNGQRVARFMNLEQNPNDFLFVSWDFFANQLFDDILNTIKDANIVAQIKNFIQINNIPDDAYVGYHEELLSIEPETMLLINGSREGLNLIPEFNTAGRFIPVGGDIGNRAAKLNNGVWLNAGMIRDAFLTSHNLHQAISLILSKMNYASGGYWGLQLFWNDEICTYQVIDTKFDIQHRETPFYKFNRGGAGECLSIEFDSQFPPELISHLNAVSLFQTLSPQEQQEKIKTMPLLGTTSAHAFVVNWTHLSDGLRKKIEEWRSRSQSLNKQNAIATGDKPLLTTLDRVAGRTPGASTPQILGSAGQRPGTPVNSPNVVSAPSDATSVSSVRQSVNPLPSTTVVSSVNVQIPKFVPGGDTKYGQRAWRNNNPGNLTYAQQPGAVRDNDAVTFGKNVVAPGDVGRFAQFATPEDGYRALIRQLAIYRDRGISLKEAIRRYAPSFENDTIKYTNFIVNKLGTSPNAPLSRVDLNELARGIVQRETGGRVTGTVPVPPPGQGLSSRLGRNPTAASYRSPTAALIPPTELAKLQAQQNEEEINQSAVQLRSAEIIGKFGTIFDDIIELHPGDMINRITKDGYLNPTLPNQYVSPFPTTTSIAVEIPGISGISVSDGFFVDKIPFLFEKHGVFQVTEITDVLAVGGGWKTTVRGYFKMLWYDGTGGRLLNE